MKDLPEALELVLGGLEPLGAEAVPIAAAAGRVAAAEARSAVDLPPFDRSAMDGFAVRAADVRGEPLRVLGDAAAGDAGGVAVASGTAVRISTGAAIPDGADSILRVEDAQVENGTVTPTAAVDLGLHVRRRGEDVRAGDVLARSGDRLTLPRVSALASAGVGAV